MTGVRPAGFPHSDICGSMDICSSPQLFAAYHVFLRLLVPRHPPCALSCLTSYLAVFHSVEIQGLAFLKRFGKFLYRFVMVYFLGCLDKKSFINLCMKFSRYHSLRYAKPLEVATQLLRHSTLSKECFMTLSIHTLKEMFHDSHWVFQWMEMERFELLTPCLQGRCSPNWATPPFGNGNLI